MCGIFAYQGVKSDAPEIILEGLKSLEYRGYDSWGIAVKKDHDKKLYIEKSVGKIGQAKAPDIKSFIGIGHTRWATHGNVNRENSHPHADCKNEVVVVHNGIVENFEELKNKLSKKHKLKSQTDTEIIAHLIENDLARKISVQKAVLNTFNKLKGLNAVIVFYPKTEEFVAIKNGSPLVLGLGNKNDEYFLASDMSAILTHTNKVYFLKDNELIRLNGKKDFSKIPFLKVNYKAEELGLGSYPHFMIKEIYEQPQVLRNLIKHQKDNIFDLSKKIKQAYGTYFIGCGTAYYACLAGTYLFSKIAKRHANASIASEFSFLIDFLKDTSLVIALSQSGETIDLVSSIKDSKKKGAKIFTITNVPGSTLYQMANYKMLLNAGPEKCVLATKSFTAKIAILVLLSHALVDKYKEGVVKVQRAIKEIERILKAKKQIQKLANKLKNKKHIYVLGRGLSYSTALESALKIKEVSYIHAEGFPAGELKHGVIALIEKGTPVVIYNQEDETYKDTLSSAHEVKARGAYIIGVSSKNNSVYDEFIKVDNCKEATIIPNVVIAQLLGYYLALGKGFDPDKPRNLAKSVTVK